MEIVLAGEIHGVISREEAWNMWDSYGERGMIDIDVDPTKMTGYEAAHIMIGSTEVDANEIYGHYYDDESPDDDWVNGLRVAVDEGGSPELLDLLYKSHLKQQAFAELQRRKSLERSSLYITEVEKAIIVLRSIGFFTKNQTEGIFERLRAPDGQSFMQHTDLSPVEYARLALEVNGEEINPGVRDVTDFSTGIIRHSISLHHDMDSRDTLSHNRLHETVHGSVAGVELYDITRDNGRRQPGATVVGHFSQQPSAVSSSAFDYSRFENGELNEGWTELVTREIIKCNPALGLTRPLGAIGYDTWTKVAYDLQHNNPDVFRQVHTAGLVEADSRYTFAKRDAPSEMHEFANRKLGKGALDRLFRVSLLTDVHAM